MKYSNRSILEVMSDLQQTTIDIDAINRLINDSSNHYADKTEVKFHVIGNIHNRKFKDEEEHFLFDKPLINKLLNSYLDELKQKQSKLFEEIEVHKGYLKGHSNPDKHNPFI